jgi:hypothetical protein
LKLIGFGDYVVGVPEIQSNQIAKSTLNMLIGFVYFFVGMALLAMCFALMQDEMKEKVELIVTKLGIRSGEDEEEEEEQEEEMEEEQHQAVNEKEKEAYERKERGALPAPPVAPLNPYHDRYDSAHSGSNSPPHYENSALDLRFEKEPTVISVKPTIESYEHDDVREASSKEKSNLTAFKREATNLQQRKRDLDNEMKSVHADKHNTNYGFDDESHV